MNFDGTGSTDPEGGPLTYAWDLNGDGAFGDASGSTASYTYTSAGTYTARLRVTDNQGASDTATVTITVGNTAPTAVIDTPEQQPDLEGWRPDQFLRPRHRRPARHPTGERTRLVDYHPSLFLTD